jgi:hypothetical protein
MIPLARLLAWLQLSADDLDETETQALEDALERALAWVSGETRRYFGPVAEFVERRTGSGRTLWLDEIPLLDAEADPPRVLTVERRVDEVWTAYDPAADEYELLGHLLYRSEGWPCQEYGLRVTMWAGYEAGEIPGDVEQLVLELVATWWRDRGNENLRSETIGGYSYTRWGPTMTGDEMPSQWAATLQRWRWARIGRP